MHAPWPACALIPVHLLHLLHACSLYHDWIDEREKANS